MKKTRHSKLVVATLALVILGAAPAWSQALGRCATVEVPRPVILPDGTLRQAATLRLCLNTQLSPVAGLHEVSVDGAPLALLQSYIGKSEGPADRHPVVVFQPTRDGAWRLIGYAWPAEDHMQTFLLHGRQRMSSAALRAEARALLENHDDHVFVAAR